MVSDPGPADESDLSVNDQQFAMRAIVVLRQVAESQLVIPLHFSAGSDQLPKIILVCLRTPDPIQHHLHTHSRPCTLCQCAYKSLRHLTTCEYVSFQADSPSRVRDRQQLRFVEVLPVR